MAQAVLDALQAKFGDDVLESVSSHGDEMVVVSAGKLVEVAQFLKDDDKMAFDFPVFVTCIDTLGMEKEIPRFEIVYQLRSLKHGHRIRLKVKVDNDPPKVPALSLLWPGFSWQERETFDMYGVEFEGHPDLRRIYMYEEFEGFPLRKDYPKDKRQPLVRKDDY